MKRILTFIAIFIFFALNLSAQENTILRRLIDLPAPPPETRNENEDEDKPARPQEFYKKENVLPDDAPIEDLIDFWKRQNFYEASHPDKIQPSEKTLQRLIESVDDTPENLKDFLKLLPVNEDVAAKVKNVFDTNGQNFDESWREAIRKWLKYQSKYFSGELFAEAQSAKDHKTYNTVGKETELRTLAKVDWEKAASLLERLEADKNNPRTAFFAKRLIYEHALETKDSATAEKYLDEFKKTVENKNASGRERDNALDALTQNKEWEGQDDWYLSLFADETLLKLELGNSTITLPLNSIAAGNPDKWIPVIAKLVGNKNRTVHNAAVQALVQFQNRNARKDALEPLLPWISNPEWAKDNSMGRLRLIQSMSNLDMPESVLPLIWAVENDEYFAEWAANSLVKYKDPRAIPALKRGLEKTRREEDRRYFYEALTAAAGYTVDEQVKAVEIYAEKISTPEGYTEVEEKYYFSSGEFLSLQVSLGKYLANQKEPAEDLIVQTIERQKILEKEKPEVAKILAVIMQKWQGRLVDLEMLRKISDGNADVETIVGALARRAELKERVLNDLYAMRGKSGLAGALAACILEDENDILSAFHSQNTEMSIGTLACARLLRKPLPVREVGALLDSENKLLALAAERYLESEDSIEARNLVFAKHPNEALILGARTSFNPAKQ
ncbi:MAG: HEAT repeat domain-containing protein, partial [Pyrinomonadaceae bacterium]